MEILLNGDKKQVQSTTLEELLRESGLHELRCATMVNGRIVKRDLRATHAIQPNDQIEIISMVGGG